MVSTDICSGRVTTKKQDVSTQLRASRERASYGKIATLMPHSFTRTVRLKVKADSCGWLDAAAVEVNQVWNWANATSVDAADRNGDVSLGIPKG